MYNKLFQKILDSSIWLESNPTRIVWITFLAAMDQDGVVPLSGVGNVAARARVSEADAAAAVACLEGPDEKNPGQDNDGRRIERIPGVGWVVLNSRKYKDLVRSETARENTRARVQRYRERKARNASVTPGNVSVTTSETETDTKTETEQEGDGIAPSAITKQAKSAFCPPTEPETRDYAKEIGLAEPEADAFRDHFLARGWKVGGGGQMKDWKAALRNWKRNAPKFAHAMIGNKKIPQAYAIQPGDRKYAGGEVKL